MFVINNFYIRTSISKIVHFKNHVAKFWFFLVYLHWPKMPKRKFQCNFCDPWSIGFIMKPFYQNSLTWWKIYWHGWRLLVWRFATNTSSMAAWVPYELNPHVVNYRVRSLVSQIIRMLRDTSKLPLFQTMTMTLTDMTSTKVQIFWEGHKI